MVEYVMLGIFNLVVWGWVAHSLMTGRTTLGISVIRRDENRSVFIATVFLELLVALILTVVTIYIVMTGD